MSENKLICIVDDDASVRDSLSLVLGLKGYDCRTYESAESFLSSLPNRPACIILDLKMTGMSGLELQNRLLSLKVPVQIIFLTAFADVQVMREAFLGNAVDFLEKPFSIKLTKDHDYIEEADSSFMVGGSAKSGALDVTLFNMLKDLRRKISKEEIKNKKS